MPDQAEVRRREATRAFFRYGFVGCLLAFVVVAYVGWTFVDSQRQHREARAIRIAYCSELEKLKTQNRQEVAQDKRDYKRNLRLLGIHDSKALRTAVESQWARELARNAPRSCPYTA